MIRKNHLIMFYFFIVVALCLVSKNTKVCDDSLCPLIHVLLMLFVSLLYVWCNAGKEVDALDFVNEGNDIYITPLCCLSTEHLHDLFTVGFYLVMHIKIGRYFILACLWSWGNWNSLCVVMMPLAFNHDLCQNFLLGTWIDQSYLNVAELPCVNPTSSEGKTSKNFIHPHNYFWQGNLHKDGFSLSFSPIWNIRIVILYW